MEISEDKVSTTKFDVNSRTGWGFTPLMAAALNGDFEYLEFLLKEGANVNDVDDHNQSALSHAVLRGHKECVHMLLCVGADVNSRDEHGTTPLGLSVIAHSFSSVVKSVKNEVIALICTANRIDR